MGGVAWTEEEDNLLKRCIQQYGEGKWHRVPLLAGLNRCRKSCRLRWLNYLRPNIKRGSFNAEEIQLIIKLHNLLGNRWSLIAGRLPRRTANDVKNYWNCHLSKKLGSQNIDQEKQIVINTETLNSMPLDVSLSLIIQPRNGKYKEGSNIENLTTITGQDEQELVIENHDHSINQRKSSVFLEEDMEIKNEISSFDLQYYEGVKVMEDKGSCSKWDWEDLVLDMDLWSESL